MRKKQEATKRRIRKAAPLLLAILQDAIAALDGGQQEYCLEIIDYIGRDAVASVMRERSIFGTEATEDYEVHCCSRCGEQDRYSHRRVCRAAGLRTA